jgi:hypothetical protein
MAGPRKQINGSQVTKLAEIACTAAEIATVMDCSADTIERRFAENLIKGRQIRRLMEISLCSFGSENSTWARGNRVTSRLSMLRSSQTRSLRPSLAARSQADFELGFPVAALSTKGSDAPLRLYGLESLELRLYSPTQITVKPDLPGALLIAESLIALLWCKPLLARLTFAIRSHLPLRPEKIAPDPVQ